MTVTQTVTTPGNPPGLLAEIRGPSADSPRGRDPIPAVSVTSL